MTAQCQTDDIIRIGVQTHGSDHETLARWSPVSVHLSNEIPEYTFEIVLVPSFSIEERIMNGKLDFVIVDPANYVVLGKSHAASSIATMESIAYIPPEYTQASALNSAGSVIFTKNDRDDIEYMQDIVGISFIVSDSPLFENWWVTKREFIDHRIVPDNDFKLLEFKTDPEDVVHAVQHGDFDAGAVPSGILEKMHIEGDIDLNEFKVLHPQRYDDYPLLISTRLYPGWVFAKTGQVSNEMSEKVSVSLLSMSVDISESSSMGDLAGWTVPQDYGVVEECMMDIKVGPFEEQPDILESMAQLKYFFAGIFLLLVLAGVNVFYVHNLNVKLEQEVISKTETENVLKRKNSIERTMAKVSSMFTYPGNIDEAINMALAEIGTLCNANRCYLFLFSKDGSLMSNTHEWCSEGVEAQMDELQDLPSDMLPWWVQRLQNDEMINITDVSNLPPEASTEKELLEMQDIRSVLVLPVFIEGHVIGFMGLDEVDDTKEWEPDDFETLQMFSTLMAMVLKRKKMEESLKESEQHLKRVLEGSNEGTWDVNLQEDILVFNNRYAEIIGYDAKEIGTSFKWIGERIHPDDVHDAINEIRKVTNMFSQSLECEYRVMGKDGKYRWVYNKGKVVEYSEDGKPLHIAGILVDISARKEAEAALIAAKKTAEDASKTKSDFLANMSHELRTPLNSVIGFSDILLEGTFGSLNDKQKRYVGNISHSGKHLLNLINDILDLSKIEAGKMVLSIEKIDIGDSLNEVESIISPLALKKDIRLLIDQVPENIIIEADKGKFKQIIYNLLSNAIKFTDDCGNVSIVVREQGDYVRMEVTDTGIGISEEDQKKLFRAFSQIDSSSCRRYEGTGLGLVLVKSFVEQHNGRIWVESEYGKGSSFIIEMPFKFDPAMGEAYQDGGTFSARYAEKDAISAVANNSKKGPQYNNDLPLILVVEDDKYSQEVLTVILNDAGYNVRFTSNGKEALELAKELQPFAMTLDIMMPDMDGWDILRNLKQEHRTENIPVVIVSILDEKDLGVIWGAFDYFVKPIDKEALLSSLERLKKSRSFEHANVLVIDDEPDVLELMGSMLLIEGYNIMAASGGREGIEKALAFSPDIIILDLMMPKIDGFDVIKELKKHPETIDIPIIVCTAKDLGDGEKKELYRDVSFVIQKGSFSKQDLVDRIREVEKNIMQV
ncbi:response regulator [Methanolobus sp. WCC5]|uniref:response regulator n=1 Tax=Methanolobus sp. WCC5 TaxID=3125785 RepID=UPI003252EBE9